MISYPSGMPSWVDLLSPDPDASAYFYRELFGWEVREAPGGQYVYFMKNGAEVAGLMRIQNENLPTVWMNYVNSPDAAAVKEKVEAAGGTTVSAPEEVSPAGTVAVFADAAGGAIFGVFQPNDFAGAQLVNAPGAMTMNEVDTSDFEGAGRFYGEVFGWELEPVEQDGVVQYGQFKLDGRLVAGCLPMGDNFPPGIPSHWRPYFGVESLEAASAQVQELGGQVLMDPMSVPEGRFVPVMDQHGAAFSIWEGSYDPPPGA